MTEDHATALRRMKMRSMRRGIKEMDLILSDFAGRMLDAMPPGRLAAYDLLLEENDHDIFAWVNGQADPPAGYADLIAEIRAGARGIVRPGA